MIAYIAPETLYHRTVFTALQNRVSGVKMTLLSEGEVNLCVDVMLVLYHAQTIHPQKLKKVKRLYPHVPIILVTHSIFRERDLSFCYNVSIGVLKDYIEHFCDADDSQTCHVPHQALSYKEKLILEELRLGKSNKEIARFYDLSLSTVKYYLQTLYAKLGVRSRRQLLIEAIE